MKLKNYTTEVSASRTIMEIEQLLAGFGATAIMKDMLSDGRVCSLAFKIGDKGYRIPTNLEGVYDVLYGGKRVTHHRDRLRNREEQCYNTAWRIIKDWIHAQLSIVLAGQAQTEEVLLPYLWDGKRTLYQAFKEGRLQIADQKERENGGGTR